MDHTDTCRDPALPVLQACHLHIAYHVTNIMRCMTGQNTKAPRVPATVSSILALTNFPEGKSEPNLSVCAPAVIYRVSRWLRFRLNDLGLSLVGCCLDNIS